MRRTSLGCLLALLLVACGDEQSGDAISDTTAAGAASAPEEPVRKSPEELASLAAAAVTSCDLEASAGHSRQIADWLAEAPEADGIAGKGEAAWRALAEALELAREAAGTESGFVSYWESKGFDADPLDYLALGQRLARGEQAAIDQVLAEKEGYSLGSLLTSALGEAYEAGDEQAQAALLAALLEAEIPTRDRVSLAPYLYELGRDDEADALIAEVRAAGEPVALGSLAAGQFMVRFIAEDGVDAGIVRFRELFGEQAFGLAVVGAVSEYERRGDAAGAKAFLESAAVTEVFRERGADNWATLALLMPEVETHLGEEVMIGHVQAITDALAEAQDPTTAMYLGRFVASLASQGCSDGCLAIPMKAIRAGAEAEPSDEDWAEALNVGYVATGQVADALAQGAKPESLQVAAVEYALGRDEPAYVAPILEAAPESASEIAGRMAAFGFWNDAPLATMAFGLRAMPPGAEANQWLNMLAGSTVYDDADPERRLAVRQLLAAWAEGVCNQPE